MISGFVSVFGATALTLWCYTFLGRLLPWARINLRTTQNHYSIRHVSTLTIAFLAGAYEAIALPIILLWQKTDQYVPFTAAITGLVGGVVGSAFISILFNRTRLFRLSFAIENRERTS